MSVRIYGTNKDWELLLRSTEFERKRSSVGLIRRHYSDPFTIPTMVGYCLPNYQHTKYYGNHETNQKSHKISVHPQRRFVANRELSQRELRVIHQRYFFRTLNDVEFYYRGYKINVEYVDLMKDIWVCESLNFMKLPCELVMMICSYI